MFQKDHIPIYQKLTDHYRSRILSQDIPPGSRIDSINRIMERHNVSRDTAKRVIHMLVNENLVVSRAGKGSFVRSGIPVKKIWAILVPFYLSNLEQLISAVYKEAHTAGRKLNYFLHYNNPDEEIRLIGSLISQGYEAIIIVPNFNESLTAGFYRKLDPGNTKILLADHTMAGSYFKYVIQSYDLGVKRVVDFLGNRNQGNFLLFGNEKWQGRNMVFELMEQTFSHMVQTSFPGRKLFVFKDLNELNKEFIEKNRVGGILSLQDSVSIRLIGRLKKWRISVPGALSLVSYGNTELTELFDPAITVVDCNYRDMAGELSTIILHTKDVNDQVVIQPKLIIRET